MPALILGIFLVLLWQFIAMGIDAAYILPSPLQILVKLLATKKKYYYWYICQQQWELLFRFVDFCCTRCFLSVIMDSNKNIENALYPIIIASQTIPTTAIAPLFVLWFGYSIWSKVLVTILITFFPIAITVYDGLKSTKREMEELLITYGANKKRHFL